MGEIISELKRAIIIFGILAIILGLIYPLAITGISQDSISLPGQW